MYSNIFYIKNISPKFVNKFILLLFIIITRFTLKTECIIALTIAYQIKTFKYGFYVEFYRGSRGMVFGQFYRKCLFIKNNHDSRYQNISNLSPKAINLLRPVSSQDYAGQLNWTPAVNRQPSFRREDS